MNRKRILYPALSLVLLSIPWLGGTGITLLLAFVPLLILQRETAEEREHNRALKRAWRKVRKQKGRAAAGPRPRYVPFWVCIAATFALWWGVTTWWIGFAFAPAVPLAMVIGSVLCTSAFMLYDLVWRRAPSALAYTVFVTAWISYELLYTRGEVSFPWLTLGGGFGGDVALVQWYEFTGMFGGSLWVLVCNLLVFEALKGMQGAGAARPRWKVVPTVVMVVPVVVSLVMYYTYKEPQRTVSVKVVQPNIDPYTEKFINSQESQTQNMLELVEAGEAGFDYIVLPETAINETIWEHGLENSRSLALLRRYIFDRSPETTIIVGATTRKAYFDAAEKPATAVRITQEGIYYDAFNSALVLDAAGDAGVHHKGALVIGVEKSHPILEYLKFMIPDLGGMVGYFGIGDRRTVFTSPGGVRSGVAICYESIYGQYYSEFVRGGAEVMFIITNDGWWGDTSGYRNHFTYARLRAIETRRSIGRSANTGISGFIDQRGDVIESLGWDERGTLSADLALNDRITLYVRFGDVIGRLSVLTFGLCMLYFAAYRVRRKSNLVE